MGKAWRNVICALCQRKWPERQSTRSTINNRPAWLCGICVKLLPSSGEGDAATVREASVAKGRKR